MSLELVPITRKEARLFVAHHHRHSKAPSVAIFQIGVRRSGSDALAGVAMVGRPVSRRLCDGYTAEVIRLCTTGEKNACSILYAACARAARAMGYRAIITYTLASEPGTSLLAAGWRFDAESDWPRDGWRRQKGGKGQVLNLFGEHSVPAGKKIRWRRDLA